MIYKDGGFTLCLSDSIILLENDRGLCLFFSTVSAKLQGELITYYNANLLTKSLQLTNIGFPSLRIELYLTKERDWSRLWFDDNCYQKVLDSIGKALQDAFIEKLADTITVLEDL